MRPRTHHRHVRPNPQRRQDQPKPVIKLPQVIEKPRAYLERHRPMPDAKVPVHDVPRNRTSRDHVRPRIQLTADVVKLPRVSHRDLARIVPPLLPMPVSPQDVSRARGVQDAQGFGHNIRSAPRAWSMRAITGAPSPLSLNAHRAQKLRPFTRRYKPSTEPHGPCPGTPTPHYSPSTRPVGRLIAATTAAVPTAA